MPLRKPKPVKMPLPFADPEKSDDDAVRQRTIWMKLELQDDPGYSWNRNRHSLWWRLWHQPPHKVAGGLMALLLGLGITLGFLYFMDAGITIPERIIFMESWSEGRTAADARRDRDDARARLQQQIEANHRAAERAKRLEAERQAARQATS